MLGTQEHLKNPSITNIKNYRANFYVPNNMAICVSGDFDPDTMIATIDKYFGDMQPNPSTAETNLPKAPTSPTPMVREVYGPEAENVTLGWRFPARPATNWKRSATSWPNSLQRTGRPIDLDLTQQQKTLSAYCYPWP